MKALLILAAVSFAASADAESLASFRGDERHSGLFQYNGVPVLHGLKWKFTTNGPVVSTPAVIGTTAYVGSNDHYLYALDVATGAVQWKFKTDSRVASSPAVSAGRVYFGSYDGNIYALVADTGRLAWKFSTAFRRSICTVRSRMPR